MTLDIQYFKTRLEAEKVRLEAELNELGQRDPSKASDWNAQPSDTSEISFRDEVADRFEDQDERKETELSLEERLTNINLALTKIEAGSYGLCQVDQEPIEADRLEANPAAQTCKKHLDQN